MGKSTKRDNYRKIVTELQNETGVKKYNASRLMSQKDCIKAIYEVISIDLQNKERKEIEKYIETNRALNNINCELKKENKELKDKTLELNNQISQKNILIEHQIEEYERIIKSKENDYDSLYKNFTNVKKQRIFILIILLISCGILYTNTLW